MGHGYAGIDNELYTDPKTGMLFADAKDGLAQLIAAVKALDHPTCRRRRGRRSGGPIRFVCIDTVAVARSGGSAG